MKKLRFAALITFLILVLLLIIAIGVLLLVSVHRRISSNKVPAKPAVVLDCGHGGPDGGAVAGDGTAEKDINLALGLQLEEILVQNGYSVVMTRRSDTFICDDHSASLREQNVSDLHNRLKIAEACKNSVFISLHMNQFSEPQYWGSQLFYSPNHPQSKVLAEYIRSRLLDTVQQQNTRQLKKMDSSVYIIYHATNPALLLECGFMSNKAELEKFKSVEYRSKFAYEVFLGINDYYYNRGS